MSARQWRGILCLSAGALLWANTVTAAPPTVVVESTWLTRPDDAPPQIVISLSFKTSDGGHQERLLRLNSGAPLEAATYDLRLKTTTGEQRIPVTPIPRGIPDADPNAARSLDLRFDQGLIDTTNDYTLTVDATKLTVTVGGVPAIVTQQATTLSRDDLNIESTFLRPRTLKSKAEVLGGTGGGVGSIRLTYAIDQPRSFNWLHLELLGTGDFNFQAQNRDKYFNNLNAEFRFFYPHTSTLLGQRYVEPWIHLRAESDQTFDNVDGLVGAGVGVYTKDPISRWFADLFVKNRTQAVVSPLLVFSYDYVHDLTSQPMAATTREIDTEGGDNRIKGAFDWSLPLLRGVKTESVPPLFVELSHVIGGPFSGGIPDADLLVEICGLYSIDESKFFDKTRLSLDLRSQDGTRTTPSLSLSWSRGEAAPLFKEVNAFLAGLKMNL